MLKRFVARLLIITQIYGNLFQGFAATMTEVETRPLSSQFSSNSIGESEQHKNPDNVLSELPFTHLLYSETDELGGGHLARGRVSFKSSYNTPYNSVDSFECNDVTADLKETYFFQGLRIAFNADGVMVVEGRQGGLEKLFLGSNRPIILNSVEARDLSLTAPRIVTNGISTIDTLRLQDIDGINTSTFVNPGQLTAKELFLKNLKAENTGGITAKRFAVDGQLASTGTIVSDELILEESAYLRLNENSSNDIKTLFLSKASHFENHASTNPVNIGILDGSGGSLTNLGTMAIDKMEVESAFQSITNRHFLDIAHGTIKAQQFENHGTFVAGQSDLQIAAGQNFCALKAKSLQIKTAFANTLSGVMGTSQISGSGHLRNLGDIETQDTLVLGIKRFTNNGGVKGLAIDGSSTLEQFDNTEDGIIESTQGLSFTEITQVNNLGVLRSKDMALYSDKTLQKGDLIARTLNLIGGTFLNQGEIEVDDLTAETGLINEVSLTALRSTDFGVGGLSNTAKAKAYLKGLGLSCDTRVINHGKLVVEGIDTKLGILQITNSGVASIDNAQVLPKASEQAPENLARIATTVGPVTWYSGSVDAEFDGYNLVESSTPPTIKLQLLNQTPGELTLKSGRFEFVGNIALVNDGTLIQDSAYTLWLTNVPGEFNRGTWKATGSLGLLSLNGSDLGCLQVEDVLHANINCEALKALGGLSKVQARRVIIQAPILQKLTESFERASRTYPWPLEMNITGGIDNNVDISAPELKVRAQSLKTSGNLFSTQAMLELLVTDDAEISASIGGQAGINLSAKKLKLLGRADIPGAVRPNVFYKRNDNGLYAQGPVVLNIAELLDNQYGVIQGSSYTIKAPQLINLAGLITATDPSLSSTIAATEIKNLRDEARGYTTYSRQQRIYYSGGKDWCGCHGTRVNYCGNGAMMNIPIANSYETSDEGVIFAQGDLTLNYHQLEMLVSRITSGGKLTLISGDKQFTYENAPDIKVLPGTTTMTVRNLHGNHVVAKQDLHVELGNANMATSMQGQNIFVNAGMLTLQSLGVQHKSQGKIVNLLSLMQGGVQGDGNTSSHSNTFKTISGVGSDSLDYTDLTLPFKHQSLPTSLVILGQDARSQLTQNHGSEGKQGNQGIDLQATMRSLEQAMGSQFYTLYRGINGLGLNIHHFFNATSDFVRGHKDTITQRRSIKSGETEQEVDVQLNPTLTPQDLLNSGILGVFLDFTKNIQGLESTHKALDDVNQTKQKSALMFAVPADHKKNPGINSPGVIEVTSKGDLGVFTNVKGKDVKLVSTDGSTTVGSETIRHQFGHNYHDQLISTRIEAEGNLLIKGKTDVVIKAIETHSGVQTDIIAQTGMVLDQSLATVDHTVSYSYDKKSSTTTKVTNVHQNVSSHSSDGKVNIKANTGILQYGVKNSNANLDAPIILQEDVHDQRMVESQTISLNSGGGWGRFIGAKERKETNFSESISRSKGCHNSGDSFIAMAKERFKAVNPTFSAKHNEITADEIELKVGTNTQQSHTQSSYQGPIWNKVSQSTENHITHRNPTFEHNIYLHSPKVILERVRGSMGTFDKIISDSTIQFKDVDDIHQSTHKSQKSLSGGAALLTKLAVGIAMMYGMPVGAFGLTGTTSLMVNAGFATLCSDATVCLVENDGDPGKAIQALSKSKIAMNVARSMLTAGLVGEISDVVGIPSMNLELVDYAQKATIQSAVNTVLAVSIDGQNFEKALMQGMTTAALSTATSYLANQIGQSYFDKQLNWLEHKTLHALLGGLSGGVSSKLFGGSFERGAISGALGAVVAEAVAEMLKPDLTSEMLSSQNKNLSKDEFEKEFMEKAQQSSKWADFVGSVSAFGMGLDTNIAYQTSSNATQNNFLPGILLAVTVAGTAYEGYQIYQTYKTEGGEEALKQLGITVVLTAATAGVATVGFKVGKAVYPSLQQAFRAALADRPMLASALTALESRLAKIEAYVKDQFDYKKHFGGSEHQIGNKQVSQSVNKGVQTNVDKLAQEIAGLSGGLLKKTTGEGYKVLIPNGKDNIVVRLMQNGGQRSDPYFKVSIPGKKTLSKDGLVTSDPALTHIDIGTITAEEIMKLVDKLK